MAIDFGGVATEAGEGLVSVGVAGVTAAPAKSPPILFSGPMVLSLLAGRKTQTRRLATSPLRKVEVGDRLWVREAWRVSKLLDDKKPSEISIDTRVWPDADRDNCDQHGRPRPGMFMPRWASRLTLTVTEKRFQRLLEISETDAIAEGVVHDPIKGWWVPGVDHPNAEFPYLSRSTPREMYAALWDVINGAAAGSATPRSSP